MNRIKELRKRKGLSQYELSRMTGIQRRQLQRFEYGENKTENMTLKTADKIAKALGVKIESLLDKSK